MYIYIYICIYIYIYINTYIYIYIYTHNKRSKWWWGRPAWPRDCSILAALPPPATPPNPRHLVNLVFLINTVNLSLSL